MNLCSVKKTYWADSHHSVSPSQTVVSAVERLRNSPLNLLDGLKDITEFGGTKIPVHAVGVRANEWGKGLLPDQSRASAIMERIERYSSVAAGRLKRAELTFGPRHSLRHRTLCFAELTPCNVQLFLVEDLSSVDNRPLVWAPSFSLTHKTRVYLPASRVFLAFRQPWCPDFTCSNGLSANNTFEEAIVQGLSELIERHAYHCFYLNGCNNAPRIDLTTVRNELLAKGIADLESLGYIVIANDHSQGLPLPTVSVLLFKPDDNVEFVTPGSYVHFGTATDPEIALTRCITESVQSMAVARYRRRCKPACPNELPELVESELLWRLDGNRCVAISSLPNCASNDFLDEVQFLVDKIEAMGHEVVVSDLTHPAIGVPVVRVTCPGLQPNFLLLNRSPFSFKSCVSRYIDAQAQVHEAAKSGRFFEQHVFEDL
jgi:ribosomal protein S12 methylthiotransferase accessory factor